jgi:hypothetical protein
MKLNNLLDNWVSKARAMATTPDESPGNGNPLLLSPRELVASPAGHGLVALRQAHDELVNVRLDSRWSPHSQKLGTTSGKKLSYM